MIYGFESLREINEDRGRTVANERFTPRGLKATFVKKLINHVLSCQMKFASETQVSNV